MKTLAFLLAFGLPLAYGIQAKPPKSPTSLATQLGSLLTYPQKLRHANWQGHIYLQFRLDGDYRITDVEIGGVDETIKADLAGQLVGKKLQPGPAAQPGQSQRVKVRFQLN